MTTDTPGSDQSDAGAGRPRRAWVGILAVLAIVGLGTWLLTPGAVSGQGATLGGQYEPGDSMHVGLAGMVENDLVVLAASARVVGDAEVLLRVCRRPDPGEGAIGGMRGDDELADFCPDLEPLRRGTRLDAEVPRGDSHDYVLVTLLPTGDGPLAYCGLDLTYRSGLRIGRHRDAGGYHAYWHTGETPPFTDDWDEPVDIPEREEDGPCA